MTAEEIEQIASGLENAARFEWRFAQFRGGDRAYHLGVAQRLAASARMIRETPPSDQEHAA